MSARMMRTAVTLLGLFVALIVGSGACTRQAQAGPLLVPFVTGWDPFAAEVVTNEPEPTGSLTQAWQGDRFWLWDRPMATYPHVVVGLDELEVGVHFPTPGGKAIGRVWWTPDPTLKPNEKDLKSWNEVSDTAAIIGGQWTFRIRPVVGQNTVRVLGQIVDAKEITRRGPIPGLNIPFLPGKNGKRKDQIRGALVRFAGLSLPSNWQSDPYYSGHSSVMSLKKLCRALYYSGSGGTPLLLDWRRGLTVDDNLVNGNLEEERSVARSVPPEVGQLNPQVAERRLKPVPHGFAGPVLVYADWLDGTRSQPFEADGEAECLIPEGVNGFRLYVQVGVESKWEENRSLVAGQPSGRPYPVPPPGKRIVVDVTDSRRRGG